MSSEKASTEFIEDDQDDGGDYKENIFIPIKPRKKTKKEQFALIVAFMKGKNDW